EDPLEVALPARRDPAPDQLAHQSVRPRVRRIVLSSPEMAVALEPGDGIASVLEGLALAVTRVRFGAPPRRFDRAAAVRRDDQVAAGLVHALPELPPRGRAAVAEVEVDGGGDGQDLRSAP